MIKILARIGVILPVLLATAGCGQRDMRDLPDFPSPLQMPGFAKVFAEHDTLTRANPDSSPLGAILGLQVDPQRNMLVLDFDQRDVKKFDWRGRLLQVLGQNGRGPGQFTLPIDLCLDSQGRVYVTDLKGSRTNTFDPEGNLLHSFMMFEGYSPRKIKVNSNGEIYIGGTKFLSKSDALLIHKYSFDGEYIKSFYPMHETIAKMYLWITSGMLFDTDREGNLYCAQPVDWRISKYDSEGKFLKEFGRRAHFYTGPTGLSEDDTSQAFLEAWIESWTQVADIKVSPSQFVFVVFDTHQPTEYAIDIYTTEGTLVKGGIATDLRLMCFDQDDFAYFLADSRSDHRIIKCSVNLPNPGGKKP